MQQKLKQIHEKVSEIYGLLESVQNEARSVQTKNAAHEAFRGLRIWIGSQVKSLDFHVNSDPHFSRPTINRKPPQ